MTETLATLFDRDIARLYSEINLYSQEENLWKVKNKIPNSGGNLALHLVGNLNTYIGQELGKIPYARHRDLEFSRKDVPRMELLQMITDTRERVNKSIRGLSEVKLKEIYPPEIYEGNVTTDYFLLHLLAHLSYHLGQINYHRRFIEF